MKISQKLILGFISIALLITVVGYISVNASQEALQKTIGDASSLLATTMLEHIDRSICNRIEFVQSTTKDLITQRVVLESNREFEKLNDIQSCIDTRDREWISTSKEEKTVFMQELINNELSEELREKMDFYEEKYGYKVFGEVFVTNKYGANAAQSGKTTDYYQADEKWWQDAKKTGLYVGDVEYDKSANVYSTDVCIRIDSPNGDFAGVIKAVLNIEETINSIKKAEATAAEEITTREFKLLSRDGKVIYATEEYEFLKPLPEELLSFLHDHENTKYEHAAYFIGTGDKAGEGTEVFAYAHSEGYKDFKGLGWILLVEHETEEIFTSAAKLKKRILTASIVITVLAIIIGLIISRSISHPIGKLSIAAAKIGKGELDTRLEIKTNDEIGELAHSFNTMAEDLQTSTTSIDNLNQEITQRKQAERKQAELLEQVEKANRELKEFAYVASHDLKAPLRGISSLAGWISSDYSDKLGEKGKEQMDLLLGRVSRMQKLIDGILQYSRVGQIEEEKAAVDLNELIPAIIDLLAPPENIEITVETELPVIECGEARITQVFQNLLSNAVKYIDKLQGKIRIGFVEENGFWKFSVADNGLGIEEEHFERIFQMFQTLSRHDENGGTGIGLTVVKKIVELYGGKIWLESKLGEGSTFFFTLPKQETGAKNEELEANIIS